jgi:hypothetical protein
MRKIFLLFSIILCISPADARTRYRIFAEIPGDSAYVDSVIQVTSVRLSNLIGPISVDSLDVYVVATEDRFRRLAGNAIPDWGAGVAIPFKRRIVIKSPLMLPGQKPLGELVAHEYTHIVLSNAVFRRPVPRWLNEGMAMYASAEWNWGDNLAMSWAVAIGSIIPLNEIEKINRFYDEQAHTAYAESYLAFKYFLDTYGQSGLKILLSNFQSGRRFDYAFVAATGAGQKSFEREFSAYLHRRYNLVSLIFDSNLLWILLAALFVVGIILNRFRRKKKLKEFDEYEKYHSTDFDYGDVEEPDENKPWD